VTNGSRISPAIRRSQALAIASAIAGSSAPGSRFASATGVFTSSNALTTFDASDIRMPAMAGVTSSSVVPCRRFRLPGMDHRRPGGR
jgi:hypothetical protein